MTILDLILGVLCTYRLTQAIVWDTVLERPASWLASLHPKLDEFLCCPHCVGFWLSLATAALVLFGGHWWPARLTLWAFGIAGGTSLIHHATGWLETGSKVELDMSSFHERIRYDPDKQT